VCCASSCDVVAAGIAAPPVPRFNISRMAPFARACVALQGAVPSRKGGSNDPLRQRMIEDMRIRNLSPHTQAAYVQQVSRFARYFGRSPAQLCPEDVRTYQVHLTDEKKLAPGSILIAVSAICLLYKVILKWTGPWMRSSLPARSRIRFSALKRCCSFLIACTALNTARS
jgi:hypothetical protein